MSSAGARVLLLSRREAFRAPLQQAFELAGIAVVVAVDVDTAGPVFADLKRPVPVGVVVDLLSIDSDAAGLCLTVHARPEAASTPVLFIGTGHESIRSTADALSMGGDGFFSLPVDASRVVAKVASYLGIPVPSLPSLLLTANPKGPNDDDAPTLSLTAPLRVRSPPPLPPDDFADTTPYPFVATTPSALPSLSGPLSSLGSRESFPVRSTEAPPTQAYRFDPRQLEEVRTDDENRALLEVEQEAREREAKAETRKLQAFDELRRRQEASRATALAAERIADEELQEQQRAQSAEADESRLERLFAARAPEGAAPTAPTPDRTEILRRPTPPTPASSEDHQAALRQLAANLERRRRADEAIFDADAQDVERQADAERRVEDERRRREELQAHNHALAERERNAAVERQVEEAAARHREELAATKERQRQAAAEEQAAEAERRRAELQALQHAIDERERRAQAEQREQERHAEEARQTEELERRRRATQAAALEEAARQAEEARVQELEARRRQLEEEGERFVVEQQAQRASEEARLQEVRRRREEAELEARLFNEQRDQRLAEEAAELEFLSLRRAEQEAELRRVQEVQAQRQAEEERALQEAQERRRIVAEQEAREDEERRARIAAEEARLRSLALERERLAAERDQVTSTLQAHEGQERLRLAELEIARRHSEEAFAQARAATAALIDSEESRLQALRKERTDKERDAQALIDEQRRRGQEEQQRLEELIREKRQLEQRAVELAKQNADREMLARARLAELEISRLRAEEDFARVQQEQQRREAAAAAAVAHAAEEQRQLETQLQARSLALAEAVAAEEARLRALVFERQRRDEEGRRAEIESQRRLQQEEERLQRLVERSEAERRAAAIDAVRLEQERADRAAEAEARLQELAEQARREAEQLASLRADEEVARAALQESRSRARLAFVSGRFDAVPGGIALLADDVGSEPRAVGDGVGMPLGGPLRDVDVEPAEAPPPLPFVALEPAEGRFDDGELPALLWSASLLGVTGAIDLSDESGGVRRLFLEEGEPVFMTSSMAADRPEEILLRGGLVTAARHARLRAAPSTSGRRMCAQLVDDGVLKLDELFAAVRGVLTEQVLALLEWSRGTFRFVQERAFAADRVRLSHALPALIAEGVRRKFDEERLWAVLGGPQTLLGPQTRAPGGVLPPLSAEETLALARLDGTRALDDVILESGLHPHVVLRAALIGVTTGAVRVLARGLPRGPAEIVARRERSVSIDRARVVDRLALGRHGDYFTFLGVDVEATPFEVHRAAQRLRERFAPARYNDSAFADLRAALQEIIDVVGDAEAVLAEPGLRDSYRQNLRQSATVLPLRQRG